MSRTSGYALVIGLLLAGGRPALALPKIHFVEKETITVKFWPLTAGRADGSTHARTLEITDEGSERVELELPWPDAAHPSRLILQGSRVVPPAGAVNRIRLDAELQDAAGHTVRSHRDLTFDNEASALYDVARIGERSLTLGSV